MPFPYFVLKASSLRSLKHKIVWYRVKLVHLTLSQTTAFRHFRRKNKDMFGKESKSKRHFNGSLYHGIFVAFVKDTATMSSMRYFENHVS